MKIGIAGPIEVESLKSYLSETLPEDIKLNGVFNPINILAKGFVEAGHEVVVFTLDSSVKNKVVVKGDKLKIVIGHYRSGWKKKIFDFSAHEFIQIKKMIQSEEIDIVHAHWSYEFAIGAILSRKQHLITFRDHATTILKLQTHPYRFSRWLMDFWVKKNGKNFNFNSPYLRDLFGKWGKQYPVIPNPVKNNYIAEFPKQYNKQRNFRIYSVFNGWTRRKNPEIAVKAFAKVLQHYENVELHFFGIHCEQNGIGYQWCSRNNLLKNIFFHGFMEHNQMIPLIKDMDLLVHTALEESFGNTLIEAQALGTPVIAGAFSGAVPWVLNYGEAGILVDVKKEDNIADAIIRMIQNSKLYTKTSKDGLENAKGRFSEKQVASEYLILLHSVLNSKCNTKVNN